MSGCQGALALDEAPSTWNELDDWDAQPTDLSAREAAENVWFGADPANGIVDSIGALHESDRRRAVASLVTKLGFAEVFDDELLGDMAMAALASASFADDWDSPEDDIYDAM